ncbi:MAG TPA: ZIP family metal transporter [Bacilli bacterium]|nr:ZIP family metal transporter [Bacilli bacterium]
MNDYTITIIGIVVLALSTPLGAAMIFFFKNRIPPKLDTIFLGFAAGVMIAASIWSLLNPAIEQSSAWGQWSFVPAAGGFILGGLFLLLMDRVIPHFHSATNEEEGISTKNLKRSWKLFLAMTIHNIPEGLSVGFAFGVALAMKDNPNPSVTVLGALALSIGISIQNFPEGASVSLPMADVLKSRKKAFLMGALSGIVEPIFAIIGVLLASSITALMPWLLSFAAGAMMFVVAEELIPGAHIEKYEHLGTFGVMAGFVIMMILDVALG